MEKLKAQVMAGILAVCFTTGCAGIEKGLSVGREIEEKQEVVSSESITENIGLAAASSDKDKVFFEITPSPTPTKMPTAAVKAPAKVLSEAIQKNEKAKVVVSGTDINIRTDASLDSHVIGRTGEGESYEWISYESTAEWYAFSYNGSIAYISSQYADIQGSTTENEKDLIAEANRVNEIKIAEQQALKEKEEQEKALKLTEAAQATATPTATSTPVPEEKKATPTPKATNTPVPTATNTPVPTATNTPIPTATNTPLPTATPIPTSTPKPTATSTPKPTATSTPKPTATLVPQSSECPYSDELLLFGIVATEPSPNYEEQKAAASVVINRMRNSGKSMYEIVSAPYQFTVFASGRLYKAIETYKSGKYPVYYDQCMQAAREVLANGPTVPYTGFCTYYPGIETVKPGEKIGVIWFF